MTLIFLKWFADLLILGFINFWIRYGFLRGVNKTAKHFGVEGYKSIFAFWRGESRSSPSLQNFRG